MSTEKSVTTHVHIYTNSQKVTSSNLAKTLMILSMLYIWFLKYSLSVLCGFRVIVPEHGIKCDLSVTYGFQPIAQEHRVYSVQFNLLIYFIDNDCNLYSKFWILLQIKFNL